MALPLSEKPRSLLVPYHRSFGGNSQRSVVDRTECISRPVQSINTLGKISAWGGRWVEIGTPLARIRCLVTDRDIDAGTKPTLGSIGLHGIERGGSSRFDGPPASRNLLLEEGEDGCRITGTTDRRDGMSGSIAWGGMIRQRGILEAGIRATG